MNFLSESIKNRNAVCTLCPRYFTSKWYENIIVFKCSYLACCSRLHVRQQLRLMSQYDWCRRLQMCDPGYCKGLRWSHLFEGSRSDLVMKTCRHRYFILRSTLKKASHHFETCRKWFVDFMSFFCTEWWWSYSKLISWYVLSSILASDLMHCPVCYCCYWVKLSQFSSFFAFAVWKIIWQVWY